MCSVDSGTSGVLLVPTNLKTLLTPFSTPNTAIPTKHRQKPPFRHSELNTRPR